MGTLEGQCNRCYGDLRANGVCPDTLCKKRFQYKGFTCIWNWASGEYNVFTRDEMGQPSFTRTVEITCGTARQCRDFIDSY